MVRSCITFSGTRVDQAVAVEVLEALRPLGIQAAFDALDHSQNQTDEKRRALELALQKARYEADRFERQYQATEPENRLIERSHLELAAVRKAIRIVRTGRRSPSVASNHAQNTLFIDAAEV